MATSSKEERDASDWDAMPDEEFRRHIQDFVQTHCPADLRFMSRRPSWSEAKPWYMALSSGGLLAPGWPVEYGGMGLTAGKHLLMMEELERGGAPWLMDSGIRNLGPVLINRGTPAQRAEYMPRMLAGDHVWCQGYSEPGAGSDLASLRTRASMDGDHLVIQGHKIWTTSANDATHMFALVRTDPAAKRKQEGISFVLLEMKQPGIRIRPIPNLAGHVDFYEVLLEGARTHRRNVVGPLHQGWEVARSQLGFERIWAGTPRRAWKALLRLEQVALSRGCFSDPAFRDRFTQVQFDVLDGEALYERHVDKLKKGEAVGAEVSALKIWATEVFQRVSELLMETAGSLGGLQGELEIGDQRLNVLMPFYEARTPTIFAGTSEVHRNLIARSVLGLPGERAGSKVS